MGLLAKHAIYIYISMLYTRRVSGSDVIICTSNSFPLLFDFSSFIGLLEAKLIPCLNDRTAQSDVFGIILCASFFSLNFLLASSCAHFPAVLLLTLPLLREVQERTHSSCANIPLPVLLLSLSFHGLPSFPASGLRHLRILSDNDSACWLKS